MTNKIENSLKEFLKKDLPNIRAGDTVRVFQKIKEAPKKSKSSAKQGNKKLPAGRQGRTQIFEGLVLARKHGKGITSTITVRKITSGIGVEKIFPLHSPNIEKIEVIKRAKVRRAKLYYLRKRFGKKAKLKRKEPAQAMTEERPKAVAEEKLTEKKEKGKEEDKQKA